MIRVGSSLNGQSLAYLHKLIAYETCSAWKAPVLLAKNKLVWKGLLKGGALLSDRILPYSQMFTKLERSPKDKRSSLTTQEGSI